MDNSIDGTPSRKVEWIQDKDVNFCFNCDTPFTITKRKHHCRGEVSLVIYITHVGCGNIFCQLCSRLHIVLPPDFGYNAFEMQRVCDNCYYQHSFLDEQEKTYVESIFKQLDDKMQHFSFVLMKSEARFGSQIRDIETLCLIGKHRILFVKKNDMKLNRNFHLYDIRSITSTEDYKVEFTFSPHSHLLNTTNNVFTGNTPKEKVVIQLESPRVGEIIRVIRQSYLSITKGFPPEILMQVNLCPANDLPLEPPEDTVLHGWVECYAAYSNYYGTFTSKPLMQYVIDISERFQSRVLDFTNAPGIEANTELSIKNLEHIANSLRFNSYFRSIKANHTYRRTLVPLVAAVMQSNQFITELRLTSINEGNSQIYQITEALQTNMKHSIQIIDFSNTKIKDRTAVSLAKALRGFRHNLKVLNLTNCNLSTKSLMNIIANGLHGNLGMSLTIEEISFSQNKMNEAVLLSFGQWLNNVKTYSNLKKLSVSNISNYNLTPVLHTLSGFPKLELVDVSFNKVEPIQGQIIQSACMNSATLHILNMEGCGIHGEVASLILKALIKNTKLSANKSLMLEPNTPKSNVWANFASNGFEDNDASHFEINTPGECNIHTLNMSNNRFREKGMIALLSSWINSEHQMDTLILDNTYKDNSVNSVVGKLLGTLLHSKPSIKSLSMSKGYGDNLIPGLVHQLASNTTLLELDVSGNQCSDLGATMLAAFLRLNESVVCLHCDDNGISPSGWKIMESLFLHNTTLQYMEFPWSDYEKASRGLSSYRTEQFRLCMEKIQQYLARNRVIQAQKDIDAYNQHASRFLKKTLPVEPPATVEPLAAIPEELKQMEAPSITMDEIGFDDEVSMTQLPLITPTTPPNKPKLQRTVSSSARASVILLSPSKPPKPAPAPVTVQATDSGLNPFEDEPTPVPETPLVLPPRAPDPAPPSPMTSPTVPPKAAAVSSNPFDDDEPPPSSKLNSSLGFNPFEEEEEPPVPFDTYTPDAWATASNPFEEPPIPIPNSHAPSAPPPTPPASMSQLPIPVPMPPPPPAPTVNPADKDNEDKEEAPHNGVLFLSITTFDKTQLKRSQTMSAASMSGQTQTRARSNSQGIENALFAALNARRGRISEMDVESGSPSRF